MKLSNERRALIAFVLSMVLFVAYDALYLGPRMKEQRARREAAALQEAVDRPLTTPPRGDSTLAASRATPASAAANDSTIAVPDSLRARPEKLITVSSPLLEITLSSRGAEIVSAKTIRYQTKDHPVELIPAGESWSGRRMMAMSLKSQTGTLPLDGIVFDVMSGGAELTDGARVVLSGEEPVEVVFRAQTASGIIDRIYRFRGDRYEFESSVRASEATLAGLHEASWSFGPGIGPTEANVKDDQTSFKGSAMLGEELHREGPGAFGREHVKQYSGTLKWAAVQTKYFLAAIYPPEASRADVELTGAKQTHRITQTITVPLKTAGTEVTQTMRVYMGPLQYNLLAQIGVGLEKNVEFGWNWIRPVSHAVLWSMQKLYHFIPNYGLVVIIISILTKVLFYRLTHKSFKSMKQMQDLQPRMQALKEKYGDDRRRLSEETMRLYREAGVNPLGGCLPMLLQMPVFIALFNVFRYTIELRGAPFVGWIDDLSQQDRLFTLPFTLPLINTDAFSLLPLLMGASMWAQSKLGGSPTGQASTAIPPGFNTLLPIVFTFMFYTMPAGLVIYWIINTVMSVAQQYYINKSHPAPVAVVEEPSKKSGREKKRRSQGR